VNSLSVALRAGYLSVRTAEGASEKQSSLKARLRNGLTYLLTYTQFEDKINDELYSHFIHKKSLISAKKLEC